jgi:hypothetical protein
MSGHKYKTKHSHGHKKSKTRRMKGGNIGVKVESGSPFRYINPVNSAVNCPGCRSDNTTGTGAYFLKTPLPDYPPSWNRGVMSGGGGGGGACGTCGNCTKPPLQYLSQQGGGSGNKKSRKISKRHGHGRGRRGMTGGNGMNNFWNFMKTPFWTAEKGGDVLAPSTKGISISGLGSPISTSGFPPIPKHQPWPYQLKQAPHSYQQKGGGSMKRGHKQRDVRSRSHKGGTILTDLQNFGRGITYNMGKLYNDFSGYSNKVYAANPVPSFGQFPRGLSEAKFANKDILNPASLAKIYKSSDSYAARS